MIGEPGDVVEMRQNRLTINGLQAQYSGIEYTAEAVSVVESLIDLVLGEEQPSVTGDPQERRAALIRVRVDVPRVVRAVPVI